MGKIFISYRRDDDPGFAQLLHRSLAEQFPGADLFMDIEGHIKPGDDFVQVIHDQVVATDALLVVIGPHWSELLTARANAPDDFVAIEIKAAPENNKRVIPRPGRGRKHAACRYATGGDQASGAQQRDGIARPERFRADCQVLITALSEHLAARERGPRVEAKPRHRCLTNVTRNHGARPSKWARWFHFVLKPQSEESFLA